MNDARALLPFFLGVIGGSTDTIGFLGLNGLFTAHITGNFVVLASHLIARDPAVLSQVLAVPVFILMSLLAALLAKRLEDAGFETLRPLLSLELLWLVIVLTLAVSGRPQVGCDSVLSVLTGMSAVAAMAVQAVLVKIALRDTPATAVMTTNTTQLVVALSEVLSPGDGGVKARARKQIVQLLPVMSGFVLGCAAGALGEATWGLLSLCMPVLLVLLALGLHLCMNDGD